MSAAAAPASMTPPAQTGAEPPSTPTSAPAAVELTARQKARLQNMPSDVRKVIEERKLAAAETTPPAVGELPGKPPAAQEKPPAAADEGGEALPAGAIDFGPASQGKPGSGSDAEMPEGDVVIEGLNPEAAKKLKELNHKTQTFRKRTQEAEKTAKEASDKLTAAETRLQQLEAELASRGTGRSGANMFAKVTAEKDLAQWETYANSGLRKLQRAMLNGEEDREFTFPDGTKRDLGADDLDYFTTMLDHVEEQREALTKGKASSEKAADLIARMSKVEGFEKHHKAAQAADFDHDRPALAAKLAIAELALSGDYILVPRGTKISEKASAAKSADTSPSEMAPPSGSKTPKTPPAEIASTMPAATRGTDWDGLLSAAKARAAKGDRSAVLEMLSIKRQRRLEQQQAA
jgi:hypothetical protein